MSRREEIITEFMERCFSVDEVVRVNRNPESPPAVDDCPCVNVFELEETTIKQDRRGKSGTIYTKLMAIAVECVVSGTTEPDASTELGSLVFSVRQAIHSGGPDLGGLCSLKEADSTRVEVVRSGNHIRAIGYGYEVQYIEQI